MIDGAAPCLPADGVRDRGFTLLEMLLALTLLGLIGAIILPSGWSILDRRIDQEARKMVVRLNAAKREAETTGRIIDTPLPEVAVEGVAFESDRNSIVYYPDGSSTGGTITLDDGEQSRQLAIDWATGKIELGDAN